MPSGLANVAIEGLPGFAEPAIYSADLRAEWNMTVHT